ALQLTIANRDWAIFRVFRGDVFKSLGMLDQHVLQAVSKTRIILPAFVGNVGTACRHGQAPEARIDEANQPVLAGNTPVRNKRLVAVPDRVMSGMTSEENHLGPVLRKWAVRPIDVGLRNVNNRLIDFPLLIGDVFALFLIDREVLTGLLLADKGNLTN